MTFRVTLKDPDSLTDAIQDAIDDELDDNPEGSSVKDMDPEEYRFIKEKRAKKIRKLCSRWFDQGEYLTVEIDTEGQTCLVVEVQR